MNRKAKIAKLAKALEDDRLSSWAHAAALYWMEVYSPDVVVRGTCAEVLGISRADALAAQRELVKYGYLEKTP